MLLVDNYELLENVTSKLDEAGLFNWRRLGSELGIDSHVLDQIETGTNPAERFFVEYAYSALTRKDLELGTLRKHMITLGREKEISKLFEKYEITQGKF